ncbi:hypothetical protein KIPB_013887, partial [Kipferlia bialata]|eukprot:g13887.t1
MGDSEQHARNATDLARSTTVASHKLVKRLREELETRGQVAEAAQAEARSLSEQVDSLSLSVDSAQQRVAQLEGEAATLRDAVETARQETQRGQTALDQEREAANEEVSALSERVKSVEGLLSYTKDQFAKQTKSCQAWRREAERLQQDIDGLGGDPRARIATLEEDCEAL